MSGILEKCVSRDTVMCIPWMLLVVALFLLTGTGSVLAEEQVAAETTTTQSNPASSGEKVVYTIHGKKDPRLQATFLATYISTSKSKACSHRNPSTATRKVKIGSKRYPITEENYRIEIPVYLEENENECGYRFSRIELMLRRLYDNDLYSSHILLGNQPKVEPIYYGYKTGEGGGGKNPLMPAFLFTGKRYFRIAKETQYICRTKWYAYDGHTTFHCFMRIRDGEGDNQFVHPYEGRQTVTHPEFGIDEIRSDSLQVDILADDDGSSANLNRDNVNAQDYFRTIPPPKKPKPSPRQTLKKSLMRWWQDLF